MVRVKGKLKKIRWTTAEIRGLTQQVAQGVAPHQVTAPGRSPAAIRHQLRRLGLVAKRRCIRRWSKREQKILRLLTKSYRLGARAIKAKGYLRNRTLDSIAQQMRRSGLGDPVISRRSKAAKRWQGRELHRFHQFLRQRSLAMVAADIGSTFGVSRSTVKRHQGVLGITVTWRDAWAMRSGRAKRLAAAAATRLRNVQRGEASRLCREAELVAKAAAWCDASAERHCQQCGRIWPAVSDFFHPQVKRKSQTIRRYLKRRCRPCEWQRRQLQHRQPENA